jgi:hypothetical protein
MGLPASGPTIRSTHLRSRGLRIDRRVDHIVRALQGGRTPFPNDHCASHALRFFEFFRFGPG